MTDRTAVIIGAGPAGLTAAVEFQRSSEIKPVVVESSQEIGGISRTVVYKGNRMDIGGHRFFSKSERVMNWWLHLLPIQEDSDDGGTLQYQGQTRDLPSAPAVADPNATDLVMLVRRRKSRIYFSRRFFDYPITLSADTALKLGLFRTFRCGMSYLRSAVFVKRQERSLEDFFINRFGQELYLTFFKSYTEKVWGVPCEEISAEWGAQRIKGLSLAAVVKHFIKKTFRRAAIGNIAQKQVETSLIEKFLYPKLGPGQLWEHVACLVQQSGGELHKGIQINRINTYENKVVSVEGVNELGERVSFEGDYFISTMPVRNLIQSLSPPAPLEVVKVSEGLVYRDFITVGLLVKKLAVTENDGSTLNDNWIYVQEPDVMLGRLQIFNNWSPWLVSSTDKIWIGAEYFCNESDPIWKLSDPEIAEFAASEMAKIGILRTEDVEDSHVVRVPKTYPAYFGSYNQFQIIRDYVDRFENLFLVGRNGMHKYNNQDHSMLTAMTAVENILNGICSKDNIWSINTEDDYHEQKSAK